MTASHRLPGTDGAGELRCVPDIAVVVGDHGPEAPESLDRHVEALFRDVAHEKRLYERITP